MSEGVSQEAMKFVFVVKWAGAICPGDNFAAQILAKAFDDGTATLRAENQLMREALTEIAAFHDGPMVSSHFDEPAAARKARNALAQVAK